MASLAKVVTSVARVALQTKNDDLIRDLEKDSQTLDRIRDSFSQILDKRTLIVWSFVEALPIKGGRKVCIVCICGSDSIPTSSRLGCGWTIGYHRRCA